LRRWLAAWGVPWPLIGPVTGILTKAGLEGYGLSGRVGVGDLNYGMMEVMLNGPVGDDAALRFAARIKKRDGYVDNLLGNHDFNSIDTRAVRLSGVFQPSDALRIDLIANYQADEANGTSFKSIAFNPQDPTTGAVIGTREPWTGPAPTGDAPS